MGKILGKIKGKQGDMGQILRKGDKEDRQIAKNFELLINVKRVKKDLCNTYYNRL